MYMYVCMCVYVCMYVYVCVCMYVCWLCMLSDSAFCLIFLKN